MGKENIDHIQYICRTCMCEETDENLLKNKLISLYESSSIEESLNIIELLNLTTPKLHIEYYDELPQHICTDCFDKLKKMYKFQQICLKTKMYLYNILDSDNLNQSDDELFEEPEEKYEDRTIPKEENDEYIWEMQEELQNEDYEQEVPYNVILEKIEAVDQSDDINDDCEEIEILNESVTNTYTCPECGEEYSSSLELENHECINIVNKDQLKASTTGNINVGKRKYKKKRKGEIKLQYECEFCDKLFNYPSDLIRHRRKHTAEKPFLCSHCGNSFSSSSGLYQHYQRQHSNIKPYECPDCPKSFACANDLSSHRSVHLKIKRNVCELCNASFCKPSELKRHQMYHSGEKPFKCKFCEMRFVAKVHMQTHERTHTGEKPYKCSYCEHACAKSYDLIKHIRSHIGEKVYRCDLCPKGFRFASDLRKHFASHKHDDAETREKNLKALEEAKRKFQFPVTNYKL